jgi:hypothetical protein
MEQNHTAQIKDMLHFSGNGGSISAYQQIPFAALH